MPAAFNRRRRSNLKATRLTTAHRQSDRAYPVQPPSLLTRPSLSSVFYILVEGGGFEPPKLARQIYSLIPLATREPLRKGAHSLDLDPPCQQARRGNSAPLLPLCRGRTSAAIDCLGSRRRSRRGRTHAGSCQSATYPAFFRNCAQRRGTLTLIGNNRSWEGRRLCA